jgi:hypothetical protein
MRSDRDEEVNTMTKKRMLTAVAAAALSLGLGAGIAAAQTDPTTPSRPPQAGSMHSGDMDATHDQMRDQMPEEMQAQCDTMHAMHAEGGTMSGGGMMNGGTGGQMGGTTSDGRHLPQTSAPSAPTAGGALTRDGEPAHTIRRPPGWQPSGPLVRCS